MNDIDINREYERLTQLKDKNRRALAEIYARLKEIKRLTEELNTMVKQKDDGR